jgi:hypothetical protein
MAVAPLSAGSKRGQGGSYSQYEGSTYILQYNLFYDEDDDEGDWENFISEWFVPLGTEVTITDASKKRIVIKSEEFDGQVEINMKDVTPSWDEWAQGLFGDSKPPLDGLNEQDMKGIDKGEIFEGMTRKGVFLAVGPPPYSFSAPFGSRKVSNKDPEADELTWLLGFWNVVNVSFDDDVVTAIDD